MEESAEKRALLPVWEAVNWAHVARCLSRSRTWVSLKIGGQTKRMTEAEREAMAEVMDGIAERAAEAARALRRLNK